MRGGWLGFWFWHWVTKTHLSQGVCVSAKQKASPDRWWWWWVVGVAWQLRGPWAVKGT